MSNIAELRAKHAAEMERAEQELAIAESVSPTPDSVMQVRTGERAWLSYRDKTPEQAIEIFQSFDIVPYVNAIDTFTYDKPRELIPAKATERSGPWAVWLTLSTGSFGTSVKMSFFVRHADDSLYRVNIGLRGPGYIGAFPALQPTMETVRDGRNRIIDRKWRRANLCGMADRVSVNGYRSDSAPDTYLHWHADQDETSRDNQHAIAMLQNFFAAM